MATKRKTVGRAIGRYGVKQDRDLWWRVTDKRGRIIRATRSFKMFPGWVNLYQTRPGARAKAAAINGVR